MDMFFDRQIKTDLLVSILSFIISPILYYYRENTVIINKINVEFSNEISVLRTPEHKKSGLTNCVCFVIIVTAK